MSRAVIERALMSGDVNASLIEQGLNALGIIDPAETRRAAIMLNEATAYYRDGVRGESELDAFFAEAGSLESAIGQVAKGYHASDEDINAFNATVEATDTVSRGFASLDDIYGSEDSDNADTDDAGDDTSLDAVDSEQESADSVDSGVVPSEAVDGDLDDNTE